MKYLALAMTLLCSNANANAGFFYFSGYNLAPYSESYTEQALNVSASTKQPVIIYSNMDRQRYPHQQQMDYNQELYRKAADKGAEVWMQLRMFDNGQRTSSADHNALSLMNDPNSRMLIEEMVDQYSAYFPDTCKIILFEEAGIYHSPQGGADFWAGGNRFYEGVTPPQNDRFDSVFIYRFTKLYQYVSQIVRERSNCELGFHIGHTPVYREYKGKRVINHIADNLGSDIDFIAYDLYALGSPSYASYEGKMRDRIPTLAAIAPVYYINQMHTMNNFGHGGGKTPSAKQLIDSTMLAYELGAAKVGWYGKNARATHLAYTESDPTERALQANNEAQTMVLESSPVRFGFALSLTAE